MEKCEYKRKLHERLHKLIDEPMTLGHIEEAGIIAGLLCSLDALHGEHAETFTEADARAWVSEMENEDGSTGEHWTQEQTAAAERRRKSRRMIGVWLLGISIFVSILCSALAFLSA